MPVQILYDLPKNPLHEAACPSTPVPEQSTTFLSPNDECDVIVCNHLLNDLRGIATPISEFARVAGMGGRMVILMLHPMLLRSECGTCAHE